MRLILLLYFLTAISASCACLKPNDAFLQYLDDEEEISDADSIPDTGSDIDNPMSKSEPLDFLHRIECPEPNENSANNLLIIKTDSTYGTNYAIEYDCLKRAPRWCAMQMYHGNAISTVRRSGDDAWHEDEAIPLWCRTTYQDHFQNGYDRGHMIASADRLQSRAMNRQTFCYSNVHPQLNELNAGVWMEMEEKLRTWNCDDFRDTLYIAKGGTIDNDSQILEITKAGLIVPKYFWMAVLCLKDGRYKAMAFWIDHRRKYSQADHILSNHVVSIYQLETFTGINFFHNLPSDIQELVEADVSINDWGF